CVGDPGKDVPGSPAPPGTELPPGPTTRLLAGGGAGTRPQGSVTASMACWVAKSMAGSVGVRLKASLLGLTSLTSVTLTSPGLVSVAPVLAVSLVLLVPLESLESLLSEES